MARLHSFHFCYRIPDISYLFFTGTITAPFVQWFSVVRPLLYLQQPWPLQNGIQDWQKVGVECQYWLILPPNRLNLHDLAVKRGGGRARSAHTWIRPCFNRLPHPLTSQWPLWKKNKRCPLQAAYYGSHYTLHHHQRWNSFACGPLSAWLWCKVVLA